MPLNVVHLLLFGATFWLGPAVVLIHSDDDRNVPFAQTVDQVRALRQHGVPSFTTCLPGHIE